MIFSGVQKSIPVINEVMKTLIFNLFVTAVLICSSCSSAAYLPYSGKLAENQYGSNINVRLNEYVSINGELIVVTPDVLYVLLRNDKGVARLDSAYLTKIEDFSLRYAKGNAGRFGWTIPASVAISISHGYFAVFTLPINVITTTVITLNSANAFVIKMGNISWVDLSKFARFPQGIPPNIHVKDLESPF
jgi:hypothetical protein